MNLKKKLNTFLLIRKNVKNSFLFTLSFFTSKCFNFVLIKKAYFKNGFIFQIYSWSDINHLVEYIKGYYSINNISFKPIVLDVGANTGDFSVAISKKANLIYAFEPLSEVYDVMVKNIALNKINNIVSYNLAVSDISSKQKMNLTKKDTSIAQLSKNGNVVVNCISWSDLYKLINCPKKIDLLKLDTEGGEYSLLNDSHILNFIDEIRMELHLNGFENKIFLFLDLLERYNFILKDNSYIKLKDTISVDLNSNPKKTYDLIFYKK